MGLGRIFKVGARRPEVEAALDAELERHARALQELVRYRLEREEAEYDNRTK